MTRPDILAKVARQEISAEEGDRRLKELEDPELYCKVAVKGGLSVYGLQRMPVTLYGDQWDRLLHPATVEMIKEFQKKHAGELKTKATK